MSPDFTTPIFFYKPYPGSPLADGVRADYPMPRTLEEWAAFEYIESHGPWVSKRRWDTIQRFKFYSRFAWGRSGGAARTLLKRLSRWRCDRDFYDFPIEKIAAELLNPPQRLS